LCFQGRDERCWVGSRLRWGKAPRAGALQKLRRERRASDNQNCGPLWRSNPTPRRPRSCHQRQLQIKYTASAAGNRQTQLDTGSGFRPSSSGAPRSRSPAVCPQEQVLGPLAGGDGGVSHRRVALPPPALVGGDSAHVFPEASSALRAWVRGLLFCLSTPPRFISPSGWPRTGAGSGGGPHQLSLACRHRVALPAAFGKAATCCCCPEPSSPLRAYSWC
jgi:hypothetical protein